MSPDVLAAYVAIGVGGLIGLAFASMFFAMTYDLLRSPYR